MTRTEEQVRGELSSCYLSQFYFTVPALWAGVYFGRRWKSFSPLLVGITVGSGMDLLHGRWYGCRELQQEYDELVAMEKSNKAADKEGK